MKGDPAAAAQLRDVFIFIVWWCSKPWFNGKNMRP